MKKKILVEESIENKQETSREVEIEILSPDSAEESDSNASREYQYDQANNTRSQHSQHRRVQTRFHYSNPRMGFLGCLGALTVATLLFFGFFTIVLPLTLIAIVYAFIKSKFGRRVKKTGRARLK